MAKLTEEKKKSLFRTMSDSGLFKPGFIILCLAIPEILIPLALHKVVSHKMETKNAALVEQLEELRAETSGTQINDSLTDDVLTENQSFTRMYLASSAEVEVTQSTSGMDIHAFLYDKFGEDEEYDLLTVARNKFGALDADCDVLNNKVIITFASEISVGEIEQITLAVLQHDALIGNGFRVRSIVFR